MIFMMGTTDNLEKILSILSEEIVPAEGCTEPIALAFAASLVTSIFSGRIADRIDVYLSGNMVKNVKSVHIPNSSGKVGIEYAVGMGAILGNANRKMMVISEVDTSRLGEVQEFVDRGAVRIFLEKDCPKLYIRLEAECGDDRTVVEIRDFHTNVTRAELNGKSVIKKGSKSQEGMENLSEKHTDRSFLTIDNICRTAADIDLALIEPLFDKVIKYNSAIANEGLTNTYGIAIGKTIMEWMEDGVYGFGLKNSIASFTAAGSDARMNGCPLPVMTTSGSGNQGMTCSLPIIKFCEVKGLSRDTLIRSLFVSHMITIHIKEVIGRLSAYCGAMAASAGASGAMAFADGMTVEQVKMAVETTLATISGVICDGAKSSCATKIATGISMAVDAYYSARKGRSFNFGEGIVGSNIESTITHVGTLGCDGMYTTDEVILHIMMEND